MTVIKCDRCGSIFEYIDSETQKFRISTSMPKEYYDLCKYCYQGFKNYMDEGRYLPKNKQD